MRLHQILTGSSNGEIRHTSLGSLGSFHFIAYASGCDVIILNERFLRVQILSGVKLGEVVVSAVACAKLDGKVAVANRTGIYIYEPNLLPNGSLRASLSDVVWCCSNCLSLPDSRLVMSLAWSSNKTFVPPGSGSSLFSVSEDGLMYLWRMFFESRPERNHQVPVFQVGGSSSDVNSTSSSDPYEKVCEKCDTSLQRWNATFIGECSGFPLQVECSPDGLYVATLSEALDKHETIVRVWFPRPFTDDPGSSEYGSATTWDYVSLAHSFRVISFCWRQTSRYMPARWVPNALITSSVDDVCRVWTEISPPYLAANSHDKQDSFHSSRLCTLPSTVTFPVDCALFTHEKQNASTESSDSERKIQSTASILPVPSQVFNHPLLNQLLTLWLNDPFSDVEATAEPSPPNNSFDCSLRAPSYPRFALATSLRLHSATRGSYTDRDLSLQQPITVYWLNNKLYRFDEQLRSVLLDMVARILGDPLPTESNSSLEVGQLDDQIALLDQSLLALLGEWQHSPDVVITVNPADGGLVVWYIHGLDTAVPNPAGIQVEHIPLFRNETGRFPKECSFTLSPNINPRRSQVTSSLRSRLHEAFPLPEAVSMLPGTVLFLTARPDTRYNLQLLSHASHERFACHELATLVCRVLLLRNGYERSSGDQSFRRRIMCGIAEVRICYAQFPCVT